MSERVTAPDANFRSREAEPRAEYWVDTARGKWRIYESADTYSSVQGQVLKKGKVVVRVDPDAPEPGAIGEWDTKQEALAYIDKWLTLPKAALRRGMRATYSATGQVVTLVDRSHRLGAPSWKVQPVDGGRIIIATEAHLVPCDG